MFKNVSFYTHIYIYIQMQGFPHGSISSGGHESLGFPPFLFNASKTASFGSKKSPTVGPTVHGPRKKPEDLIAEFRNLLSGVLLGFGPIQFVDGVEGFHCDFMGFHWDLIGIELDLIGIHLGFHWDLRGMVADRNG